MKKNTARLHIVPPKQYLLNFSHDLKERSYYCAKCYFLTCFNLHDCRPPLQLRASVRTIFETFHYFSCIFGKFAIQVKIESFDNRTNYLLFNGYWVRKAFHINFNFDLNERDKLVVIFFSFNIS